MRNANQQQLEQARRFAGIGNGRRKLVDAVQAQFDNNFGGNVARDVNDAARQRPNALAPASNRSNAALPPAVSNLPTARQQVAGVLERQIDRANGRTPTSLSTQTGGQPTTHDRAIPGTAFAARLGWKFSAFNSAVRDGLIPSPAAVTDNGTALWQPGVVNAECAKYGK